MANLHPANGAVVTTADARMHFAFDRVLPAEFGVKKPPGLVELDSPGLQSHHTGQGPELAT